MQNARFCIHLPGFQRKWGGTGDYRFGSIPFRQKRQVMSSAQAGMADDASCHPRRAKGPAVSHKGNPVRALPVRKPSSAIPACAEDITYRFWRKGIDPNR